MSFSTMSSTLAFLRNDFRTVQKQFEAEWLVKPGKVNTQASAAQVAPLTFGTGGSDIIGRVTCWSSRRMTELMNWRNPQVEAKPTVLRSIINITKRAVTEVALPFLAVTAAVETVATQALILGAKVLQPLSKRPLDYLNSTRVPGINQSARFTALWTVANLWHNVRQKSLPILELDARNRLFKGYFKL
ncbi:MAG: hypothetical protein JSR37_04625 [Verrucomicrobia bacterium]|nr:hypothetical protein [Verrucomicrobiota bacterium]